MNRRFATASFLLAALLIGSFLGWLSGSIDAEAQSSQTPQDTIPVEQLRELSEVYSLIRQNYVEDIPPADLIRYAMRGMVASLDPNSAYLDEEHLQSFRQGLTGEEYGGIGIYIGQKNDVIEVISPIYDTPAFNAKMGSGDLILKIDGVSTRGMEVEDAVSRMRGKVDSILNLEVLQKSNGQIRQVELIRKTIVTPSVMSALIDGYGYLRVTRFQDKTTADFVKNLNGLYSENGAPLRGIILDLRYNPGGYLDAGINVASAFLPSGATVVSDKGRSLQTKVFIASKESALRELNNINELLSVPMVVLVNSGSASASEIVAGSLQDHRRGVIMGRRTYGKASVQTINPLNSSRGKTALRLTMSRYFTPLGRNIQGVGITPDIGVGETKPVQENKEGYTLREENILGSLENDKPGSANNDETKNNEAAARPPFIGENDYQYEQAMLVLRALAITATR